MICTVIVDVIKFCDAYNKRDCHVEWQPLSLIPTDVIEYIKSAKCDEVKKERFAAYSALFISIKEFLGKTGLLFERNEHGKPYLIENGEKSDIEISLSHSDGLAAISISNDFEVGVDIQFKINSDTAKRLEKRFFEDVKLANEEFDNRLYLLEVSSSGKVKLESLQEVENIKIVESNDFDFTSKWAFSEAVMKCVGEGFLSASRVQELSKQIQTQIHKIEQKSDTYTLVIAKKRL